MEGGLQPPPQGPSPADDSWSDPWHANGPHAEAAYWLYIARMQLYITLYGRLAWLEWWVYYYAFDDWQYWENRRLVMWMATAELRSYMWLVWWRT